MLFLDIKLKDGLMNCYLIQFKQYWSDFDNFYISRSHFITMAKGQVIDGHQLSEVIKMNFYQIWTNVI